MTSEWNGRAFPSHEGASPILVHSALRHRSMPREKQEQLLQMLRDHRSMTPQEIWDGIAVSKQGALDLLRPLMKAGLVKRVGTRKSGRYILG